MPAMALIQSRAEATRLTLIETVTQILATEGYAVLSEAYICERSGVTRGALRYHFPRGRYDLLPAFTEHVVDGQARRLAPLGELSPRERCYLVLMSMQSRSPSAATVALLELWMAARGDAELSHLLQPVMARAMAQMMGGDSASDDPEVLALRCLIHGASLHAFSPEFSAERLQAAIAWVLEHLPPPAALTERLAALNALRAEGRQAQD